MAEHGGKAPPPKGGAEKKSGGGFWGFVGDLFKNVSVDFNVGKPGRPGPSARNPTDPEERMEPVHAERKEAYEETIYRKTEGAVGTAPAVRVDRDRRHIARSLDQRMGAQADAKVPQGGGSPLSRDVRAKMEPRLGSDLSGVRVHTSGESASAAQDLSAKAFTVGSDVHFGSGQYQPGTKEGDKLIAHELTHVVQGQRSGIQRKSEHDGGEGGDGGHEVSDPSEPAEKEADSMADHVADDLHGDEAHAAGGEGDGDAHAQGHEAKNAGGGKGDDAKHPQGDDPKRKDASHAKGDHAKGKGGDAKQAKDVDPKQGANSKEAKTGDPGAGDAKHGAPASSPAASGGASAPGADAGAKAAAAGGAAGGAPTAGTGSAAAAAGGAAAEAGGGTKGGAAGGGPDVKQQAPAVAAKLDPSKIHRSPKSESTTPPTQVISSRKIFRGGAGGPPPSKKGAPPPKAAGGPPPKAAGGPPPSTKGAPPPSNQSGQKDQKEQKPAPTDLKLGVPLVQTNDMPVQLELEAKKLTGSHIVGNAGGDLVAAAKNVESKGGKQDGTVLTLPPVAPSTSAGSIDGIAQGIIAATGVSAVVVSKVGEDVQFEPQINPKAPPSLKLQPQTEAHASTLTGWWDKSKLTAKGVKNINAWLSYWRTPESGYFIVADDRGNFALQSQAKVQNPADLADVKDAVTDKFGSVRAQWQQQLTDPLQMLSDLPGGTAGKILDGYQATKALATAEDKARDNLVAKIPTFHAAAGPSGYKPITKGEVLDAVKQGGPYRTDFLQQGGEGVAEGARGYALTKVDPAGPKKAKVEAGVHYDGGADDFGIVRVPKQNDEKDHNYYFPREMKRIPEHGLLPDGTYKVVYKGYKNAEFTVTVGEGDMVKSVEGAALAMKVPNMRGLTQDSPNLAPPAGQLLERTHLIGDWFSGSGYKESLNLVTCSKRYNREFMGGVEKQIASYLSRNLPTKESEFSLKVDVDWATGKTPEEMINQVVAGAQGELNTQERRDSVVKGLQTFLAGSDKRRVVKGVRYLVSGVDKTGKGFSVPFPPVGPDIYFAG